MLKHRHAMHARIIFWGWVDCLKHCKWCLHSYKRKVEYVACRLQSGYKMQTENLKSFLFGMVISCHLATYQASCNRFSAISFHDYLHYCGIFLAHFLMKIDRNIISSLQYSLLTLRASWLVWCLYRFYQRNKSRCRCKWDVTIEYLTRKTFEKQLTALHVVCIIIFFKWNVFILLTKMWTKTKNMDQDQKCRPRPKLFLQLDIFSTFVDHITITYFCKSFIPDSKIK